LNGSRKKAGKIRRMSEKLGTKSIRSGIKRRWRPVVPMCWRKKEKRSGANRWYLGQA
jgi:hypothetical protein